MLSDYLAAQIPTPMRIIGVALRPYSLGHDLLLQRFGSPFITQGAEPDMDALLFGLFVCSRTFEQCLADLDTPGKLEEFAATIGTATQGAFDTGEECLNFYRYLLAGRESPRVWHLDKKGDNIAAAGAPYVAQIKIVMQSEIGMTESEVLNRPLRLTYYDFAVWAETKGYHRLYSQEDADKAEFAREYFKAHPEMEDPDLYAKLEAIKQARHASQTDLQPTAEGQDVKSTATQPPTV